MSICLRHKWNVLTVLLHLFHRLKIFPRKKTEQEQLSDSLFSSSMLCIMVLEHIDYLKLFVLWILGSTVYSLKKFIIIIIIVYLFRFQIDRVTLLCLWFYVLSWDWCSVCNVVETLLNLMEITFQNFLKVISIQALKGKVNIFHSFLLSFTTFFPSKKCWADKRTWSNSLLKPVVTIHGDCYIE